MRSLKAKIDRHTLLGLVRLKSRRYSELAIAFRLRHDEMPQLTAMLQQLIDEGAVERRRGKRVDVYAIVKPQTAALPPTVEEQAFLQALMSKRPVS